MTWPLSWQAGKFEVDATHNSLIAVTNAGKKPTEAVLTFHYDRGQEEYEVRRTIAPGDQLWLNLGDIIRNGVPDTKGKTFPADLTWGTYDIREPNRNNDPSLFEGKIIVDKTYGHLAYGCTTCCGDGFPWIEADPENLSVLGQDTLGVWATNSCTGYDDNLSGIFSGWDTNNHAVAMMSSRQITGMGAGSTTDFSSGTFNYNNGVSKYCSPRQASPQGHANITCAIPTNFRQTVGRDAGNGVLHFEYAWDSSTGHLSDLSSSGCTVNENVSYPGGNPFYWPSPPWASGTHTNNPTILPSPPLSGADGALQDDHSPLTFQRPYQAAAFTATQYYQYSCTCDHSSNVNLAGPISIARSVSMNSGGIWKYTITKSGVSAYINPLP